MRITAEQIYRAVPHADPDLVSKIVDHWDIAEANGVTDRRSTSFFLGHAATETAGFTRLEENLFYTTPARLCAVWPSRFKTIKAAEPYVKNPVALANLVYGGRMGSEDNGTNDDDGWNYRGSGMFQTTGRDNFGVVANVTKMPVVSQPELLRTMPAALEAAAIYWRVNKLGALLSRPDAIAVTTKAIQGGNGGLADRTIYINRFMSILSGATASTSPPSVVVRRGDRGEHVKAFQEKLKALGMYAGKIDGDFGPGTENAVREFQEANNLHPIDGVIGPLTRAEFES